MSRRTVATLLAVVLLVVLAGTSLSRPVGYTVFSPGPTINVLGSNGKKQIITVSGHKAFRDDGGIRLVTVYETAIDQKVTLFDALRAWVDPNDGVYPHDVIYQRTDTTSSVRQESAAEMTSSQDNAVAAALRELHVKYTTAVKIATVDRKGPAKGRLKPGDLIVAVDGVRTSNPDAVVRHIKTRPPGSRVTVTVDRSGRRLQVPVTTGPLGPKGRMRHQSRVGVGISPSYRFPFDVGLHLSSNIGGPSAGLMFSLGVYDVLTPGSLTGGKIVAGTGTIDARGRVGPIGGIRQKMVGAQRDGAKLFFVPAGNCAEALGGHWDPSKMRLVRVTTMPQALAALKAWTKNPNAELPGCRR
ncbi:YlbL family protein [Nocardioides terrisoli]|uniref:YlbL family protein n=1 Tax=Nocardioides terrisoli TaxID=3388267 RepID=UPI00287B5F67|nr:PDZ domain-containing protein [Nocardioides marmorisolisilvae]